MCYILAISAPVFYIYNHGIMHTLLNLCGTVVYNIMQFPFMLLITDVKGVKVKVTRTLDASIRHVVCSRLF